MFSQDLYTFSSLWAKMSTLKIQFLLQGCRAILIDKDRNPKWMPPRLEQVHDEAVEQYFSRIDDPQWEDLNLPARRSHGRNIESKL